MSTLTDLESARDRIQSFWFVALTGSTGLLAAIDSALAPPSPTGTPSAIKAKADDYAKASDQTGSAAADLHSVAVGSLPAAWRGAVAETAAQAVQALSEEVVTTRSVLGQASLQLDLWSTDLRWAQSVDQQSRALLEKAKGALGPFGLNMFGLNQALQQATAGANGRVSAAQRAQDSGTATASLLNQLAQRARAERVSEGQTDAISAVVLANDKNPGGATDDTDILTPNELSRASQRLDGLSAADQAAFEKLVADSKSPTEAAYLWKALAAGHTVAQVSRFDTAIHPHGDDPTWLAGHLTPDLSNPQSGTETTSPDFMTYQGQSFSKLDPQGWDVYDQGKPGDCVAASTVVAQATLDPVTMLDLTTGGTADGDDSPQAFHDRLQQLYVAQYVKGQQADGDSSTYPKTDGGLGSKGETVLANSDLAPATGSTYHYVGLGSTSDRQNAVSSIEQSVDAGKPVPLDVTDGNEGHQMMIIGHDGDKLEVYNPWGYSAWVTENQFVNNQLGSLTTSGGNGKLNTADGLELPR